YAGEALKSLPAGKASSTTMLLRVKGPSAARQVDGLYAARGDIVGSVGGILREEVTEQPVEGARLVVLDGKGLAATSITTLGGGRFHASLPEGSYQAVAVMEGHPDSAPLPFEVRGLQQTVIQPQLPRAAIFSAEILDDTGRLIPAKVTLDADYGAE